VTELDQDLKTLVGGPMQRIDGAHRGARGGRTVTKAVDHTEQSGTIIDGDRDLLVTADGLAR
jgi:hypothetical protein